MNVLLAAAESQEQFVPSLFWCWPFVAILLAIAILPLMHRTHHWWEQNSSKLLVAAILGGITLGYYYMRDTGVVVHGEDHDAPAAEEHHDAHPPADAQHEHAHAAARDANDPEPNAADHHHPMHGDETHAQGPGDPHDEDAAHAAHVQHRSAPGVPTVFAVLDHAVLKEYIPFIVLLFALYVVAGGIVVRGDIRATPLANTTIIGIGGVLASFIGTTGAAMLLIRLLLKTNSERKHVVHTVIFFIFIVANIGGSLLPIGDPPLFLGYLRGVPFLWTFNLAPYWATMMLAALVIYYLWDTWAYKSETPIDRAHDAAELQPLAAAGLINIVWILGVVLAVALLDPSKPIAGWHPWPYLREGVQLLMAGLSLATTPRGLRSENQFNYVAIGEVACLFIGIFITMQVPIEILHAKGSEMGLTEPWQFFWATGMLSSFLDNAPTYVVFFETAAAPGFPSGENLLAVTSGRGEISVPILIAISCGAVFMGANSYIGNGPNFMVKSIAEQSGVKMPSFFGYMAYSGAVLIPLFVILTLVFFI